LEGIETSAPFKLACLSGAFLFGDPKSLSVFIIGTESDWGTLFAIVILSGGVAGFATPESKDLPFPTRTRSPPRALFTPEQLFPAANNRDERS
jgi:hypothetical protein